MNADLESSIRDKIGFTEDDLNANRDGKLSDSQYQKLVARRQGLLGLAGIALIIAAGVFARVVFDNSFKSADKLSIVLLTCLALAVALLYGWLKWSQYTTDLEREVAFATEGKLKLITYQNRGNRIYQFRVNREQFGVDKLLFDLLSEVEKEYPFGAAYYAPRTHILLSFEPLDDPKYKK